MKKVRFKVDNVKNYKDKRGWLCGQFFPEESILKTNNLEVKYGTFEVGEEIQKHYHPYGEEVLIIIKGKMKAIYDGEEFTLSEGDFVFQKPEVRETLFQITEAVSYITARTPSVPSNKVNE